MRGGFRRFDSANMTAAVSAMEAAYTKVARATTTIPMNRTSAVKL
jgi:hypothetical protein